MECATADPTDARHATKERALACLTAVTKRYNLQLATLEPPTQEYGRYMDILDVAVRRLLQFLGTTINFGVGTK